jgi:parallel beta-helix repeat protein
MSTNKIGDTEMNKTLTTLFTLTAMAVLPLCVCADEGKTPIYEPTIITQPGSYVVTQDIIAASGPGDAIIDIQANDVKVDLNGYSIENTGAAEPVVDASGFFDIFLTNGTLRGGSSGFQASNAAVKARVQLENLAIKGASGHGIDVSTTASGSSMNIKASKVSNAGGNGINASTGPSATVDIVDNTVEDVTGGDGIAVTSTGSIYVGDNTLRDIAYTGVRVTGSQGAVIEDNRILNIGTGGGAEAAISIMGAGLPEWGNQIRGNTLSGGGADSVGIKVGPDVNGNILSENTATMFTNGIMVDSSSNIIRGNNIGSSGQDGIVITPAGVGNTIKDNNVGNSGGSGVGDGIKVDGGFNIVRENQCQSFNNPLGVGVSSADPTNVVHSNMLSGNPGGGSTGAIVDPGDAGGNFN